MKDIAKVSLVIIGSLIGAGFASGQEIAMFFNCYGLKGICRNTTFLYPFRNSNL